MYNCHRGGISLSLLLLRDTLIKFNARGHVSIIEGSMNKREYY